MWNLRLVLIIIRVKRKGLDSWAFSRNYVFWIDRVVPVGASLLKALNLIILLDQLLFRAQSRLVPTHILISLLLLFLLFSFWSFWTVERGLKGHAGVVLLYHFVDHCMSLWNIIRIYSFLIKLYNLIIFHFYLSILSSQPRQVQVWSSDRRQLMLLRIFGRLGLISTLTLWTCSKSGHPLMARLWLVYMLPIILRPCTLIPLVLLLRLWWKSL